MKVLVIEDNNEIADDISQVLHRHWPEAKLLATHLGNQGVKLADTESPDLVILNLELPDKDGLEVLKRIRFFSTVPILVLTVRGDGADKAKALEWGADEYLSKPFRQAELTARIKALIEGVMLLRECNLAFKNNRGKPLII